MRARDHFAPEVSPIGLMVMAMVGGSLFFFFFILMERRGTLAVRSRATRLSLAARDFSFREAPRYVFIRKRA